MKKADVHVGGVYMGKVAGRLAKVRLDRESLYGGWEATNLATGRTVRIRTAARLRYDARGARAAAVERLARRTAYTASEAPDSTLTLTASGGYAECVDDPI